MAQAYKCDRCKQYKDGQPFAYVHIGLKDPDSDDKEGSICESCTDNVIQVFEHNPVTGVKNQ